MFKRFALVSSSGLLKLTLFSLAFTGAAWMVFGSAAGTKKAIGDSGLYDSIVDSVFDSTAKAAKGEGGDLPLDQPELRQAVQKAFPPEFLRASTETFIDGMFAWLTGDTKTPNFVIDLTAARQQLITGMGDYAQKRYDSLPPCTPDQLMALNTDVDAFQMECRSPLVSSASIREKVESELINSKEFLGDTVLTAENLPKDSQGKTFTDNLAAAPSAYGLLRLLPWVLGVLSLLLAVAVVFLSESKTRGLRSVGITLVGTGVFLLISALFISWLLSQSKNPGGGNLADNKQLQSGLVDSLKSLTTTYNSALRTFYISYIALGGGTLTALWFKGRGQKAPAELTAPETTAKDTEQTEPKAKEEPEVKKEESKPKVK